MHKTSLFAGLGASTRDELYRRGVSRQFVAGESLFRQGERPRELFLLRSGRAKIWRATESGGAFTLTVLSRGMALGTFGPAAGDERWPLTATAMTDLDTIAWSMDVIRRLMEADSVLAIALLGILTSYSAAMVERLEELAAVPVEQRLARMLLRMVIADGAADELPLSRQDLADLTFSTLPTISRIMSRFRQAGLVDGGRGRVRLLDRDGLAALAMLPGVEGRWPVTPP